MNNKSLAILLILFTSFSISTLYAATPTICDSQYVLCAYAKCDAIKGQKNKVSCHCQVKSGYSIGSKPCQAKGQTPLQSRYFPVKKYVSCNNDRPWANCYNSACKVNDSDSNTATCICSLEKNKGPYMYANDDCKTDGCEQGIISSFVIKDATKEFDALKTVKNYDKLPAYAPQLCQH